MARAARRAVAVLLIAVAVLLAPVAAAASWLRTELLSTDAYVATMTAVLDDAAVQTQVGDAVGDVVADRVLARLDAAELGAVGQAAQVPVARLVRGYAHAATTQVVGSDAFGAVWAGAHRTAHRELMALARGSEGLLRLDRSTTAGGAGAPEGAGGSTGAATGTALTLPLAPLVTSVQQRLELDGLPDLGAVTPAGAEVVLLRGDGLAHAVDAVRLLDVLGRWLPWAVAVLGLLGVLLVPGRGRDRRRTVRAADGSTTAALAFGGSGTRSGRGTGSRRPALADRLGAPLRAAGWTGASLAAWAAVCGLVVGLVADRVPDLVAGSAGEWGDLGSAVVHAVLEAWGGGLSGLLLVVATGGLLLTGIAWAGTALLGLPIRRARQPRAS